MKAIILCAGYGTRLGDLTREISKPMLRLEGKPLLQYIIEHLAGQGFDELAINLHFQPEQIESYFGDGSEFGVRIHYRHEPELLGTAGAVKNFEPWLKDTDDFLVMYGDILTDQDLMPLWETHQRHDALATLLVHRRQRANSLVAMDDQRRITAFVERPTEPQRESFPNPWTNSVVQILSRQVLDYIPVDQIVDLPRDIYVKLHSRERMYGVPLTGYRCAIDSPARYEQAQGAIRQQHYRPEAAFSRMSSDRGGRHAA